MRNHVIEIPNAFSIDLTVENFDVRDMCLSAHDGDIVTFGENNEVRVNFQKFKVDTSASYRIATIPSALEEEGTMLFYSGGTDLLLNGSMHINRENQMESEVKEFGFTTILSFLQFDGSYISQVLGSILTYILNLFLELLMALAFLLNKYGLIMVQDFINIFLKQVSRETYLSQNLILEGGLFKAPQVVADRSIEFEFDYRFESVDHPNM